MNCSNLNTQLHNLHVIDSPVCVCSHSTEGTAHFSSIVHSIQNIVSRFTEFKLKTLLFGDKNLDNVDNTTIILAAHDHIKDSERF